MSQENFFKALEDLPSDDLERRSDSLEFGEEYINDWTLQWSNAFRNEATSSNSDVSPNKTVDKEIVSSEREDAFLKALDTIPNNELVQRPGFSDFGDEFVSSWTALWNKTFQGGPVVDTSPPRIATACPQKELPPPSQPSRKEPPPPQPPSELEWSLTKKRDSTKRNKLSLNRNKQRIKTPRVENEPDTLTPIVATTSDTPEAPPFVKPSCSTGYFKPKGIQTSVKKSKKGKGRGKKSSTIPELPAVSDIVDLPPSSDFPVMPVSSVIPDKPVPPANSDVNLSHDTQSGGFTEQTRSDDFKIERVKVTHRKKFNTTESTHILKLNTRLINRTWKSSLDVLTRAIEFVFENAMAGLHDDDLVRVYLRQNNMETPIVIPLTQRRKITVDLLLQMIEKILQSNENIVFNETFEIHVGVIRLIRGGRATKITNLEEDRVKKKSIIRITNTSDKLCMARAICVGLAYSRNDPDKKKVGYTNKGLQTQRAMELTRKAGIDPEQPCGLEHVELFEKVLNIQIIVVKSDALNTIVYRGSIKTSAKIYLLYHNSHFDCITKLHAFYGAAYMCDDCLKPYYKKSDHKCANICSMCYTAGCKYTNPVSCKRCNRTFRNKECFDRHLERKNQIIERHMFNSSICDRLWLCITCKKLLQRAKRSPKNHCCEEFYCLSCHVYHMGDHYCYIEPGSNKEKSDLYIFFDFETNQETGEHIPNFCVANKVCNMCISKEDDATCKKCVLRTMVFKGTSTVYRFGKWLFNKNHKGYTVIAHNGGNFDTYFLLRYLVDQTVCPEIIYTGGKIMYLYVKCLDIRIVDSFNLISTRLANFPKTFDISMKKGWFPHLFNTAANQEYVGEIPGIEYYGVDDMSSVDKKEFLEWHAEQVQSRYIFDFQKEILAYCTADVEILRKCCLKFRELILDITKGTNESTGGIDPLQHITVASLCFAIYKLRFLKENTIAKVPSNGIVEKDQFSRISIHWLEWLMYDARQRGEELDIEHALNKGEHRIGRYKCDGFDRKRNVIYEFFGCWVHGCKDCYEQDVIHPRTGTLMSEVYKKTMEKLTNLRPQVTDIVYIWEHDFRKRIVDNTKLEKFVQTLDIQDRLDPRDAFFGGRTCCTKLYYEAEENTSVQYLDFTSLYPSVLKTKEFPLKYPEVITKDFQDIRNYVGFVKCKILPPKNLYLPVLPYRSNDRLMFPLCSTCCDNLLTTCNHDDEQRALIGTWVSFEILKSLEKGYRILKIYEVYHFPTTTKFNGVDENTGLFTKYINTFLKIKQQASGWPDWIRSEEDKTQYIQTYREHEGILLDQDKIVKNPGLRSVAKMCLNTLWGKFAQRNGLSQTTFVTEEDQFYEILNDATKEVTDFHDVNEEIVLLDWKAKKDFAPTGYSSNLWLAAFTTAHARLELYAVLEKLDVRTLYFDTDSIIFYTRPGDVEIPCGDMLGQLCSELEPGDSIQVFASGGPKNYTYKTKFGKTVTKVRGFTLNSKNSEIINFGTVSDMVRNVLVDCECKNMPTSCPLCLRSVYKENKITRKKKEIKIVNRDEKKDYRIKFVKRVIQPDLDTVPYGYSS